MMIKGNKKCYIEATNFSPEEATSPEAIRERIHLISDTFLVAEIDGEIAGYIEGPILNQRYVSDNLFCKVGKNDDSNGYILVTSLSISKSFQGQGVGTALIAALKDLAVSRSCLGISLTCHDYLIPYYEMNDFVDEGESRSTHGGAVWYNMVWENSSINIKNK